MLAACREKETALRAIGSESSAYSLFDNLMIP